MSGISSDQLSSRLPQGASAPTATRSRSTFQNRSFMPARLSSGALGDAALGYEPRYDRCHSAGFWPRRRHALVRNFVTHNRTEKEIRPRIATCGAAFGAGMIAGTWKPNNPDLLREGYDGIITQVGFGCFANWLGEFVPDVMCVRRREKSATGGRTAPE